MSQCPDAALYCFLRSRFLTTILRATMSKRLRVSTKNVSRTENGDDFEADLTWMSDTTQEVYALRQFWRADVMSYLTEDTGNTYGQLRQPKANGYPASGSAFMRYANSVLMRSHALNDDTGGAITSHMCSCTSSRIR